MTVTGSRNAADPDAAFCPPAAVRLRCVYAATQRMEPGKPLRPLVNLARRLLVNFGCTLTQLQANSGEYKAYHRDELMRQWMSKLMVFPEDWRDPALADRRDKIKAKLAKDEKYLPMEALRRKAYVQAVLDLPRSEAAIKETIARVSKNRRDPKTPGCSAVLKWRRKYERAETWLALLDNADGRGRTPDKLPLELDFAIRTAIASTYMVRPGKSVEATWDVAKGLILIANDEVRKRNQEIDENNELGENRLDLLPDPTLYQVRRMIDGIDAFDKDRARKGLDEATRIHRSTAGHHRPRGPLFRTEIDHTKVDVFLVDGKKFLPLGRPNITVCIDVFTRAILGIHVSFDPPSYRSVARCLQHALMPKPDQNFDGVTIVNPWFAYGTMYCLGVDNGREFHSNELDAVCLANEIELDYAGRKTGWHKPHIERYLGTQSRQFIHGIPGTTFSHIREKGDYQSKKMAILTLDEFIAHLHYWICDVYSVTKHESLGRTPKSMWESLMRPDQIPLLATPIEVEHFIGYRERSVIDENGVQLKNLQYNSPDLTALRARFGSKLSNVDVRWSPDDLGKIWVFHDSLAVPLEIPALDFEYANGLSAYQHSQSELHRKALKSESGDEVTRLKALVSLQERTAEAMVRAGRGKPYKDLLTFRTDLARLTHGGSGIGSGSTDIADDLGVSPKALAGPANFKIPTNPTAVDVARSAGDSRESVDPDQKIVTRVPKTFNAIVHEVQHIKSRNTL